MRVTAKDCRWDYFNGTGKGGQNRNKNKNCVRCFHDPSGAMGSCTEYKERPQNKKRAFERMANTKEFQSWIKLETQKVTGALDLIKSEVRKGLSQSVVEIREDGKWVKAPEELQPNFYDVKNAMEE